MDYHWTENLTEKSVYTPENHRALKRNATRCIHLITECQNLITVNTGAMNLLSQSLDRIYIHKQNQANTKGINAKTEVRECASRHETLRYPYRWHPRVLSKTWKNHRPSVSQHQLGVSL